jgi:CubicO group peptidase (beta-lactamase class C family)
MRTVGRILPLSLALLACATGTPGTPRADDLDTFVTAQMEQRHVPGLSLAIIQDGRIVEARAYGVTEAGGRVPVTPSTLFQAGSISKSVAALGALHLVEQGKLDLDGDVNLKLTTWKVPTNGFVATRPVTLRGLLSHTAGLTVHGFPGYAVDAPMPTLVQVLDGAPPANTAPIRVDVAPGSLWRYSGGGYTVMQQMMLDVTGRSFPEYMRQTVLAPIGMTRSSYEQPLPPRMASATASGHYANQQPVKGRWHLYPEMAAAGLWTTPTDLARFAIEVQQSFAGNSSKVISPAMTRRMLTVEKDGDGLGVFLQGSGASLLFNHGGRDEGFDASLNAFAETGQGLVVMINANDNSRMMNRIVGFVARKYGWPTASTYVLPVAGTESLPLARLQSYTGRYELSNNNMITFVAANGRLYSMAGGLPDEAFVPVGGDRFASADRDVRVAFTRDAGGGITGLTWTLGDRDRTVPRVGPLVGMLARQVDPDPAFTARLDATLRAMVQGGAPVASAPALTAGAQRDFSRGPWPAVAGYRGVTFIGVQEVGGRKLERHGHPVDRIAYYTLTTDAGSRSLLVHVTREGLITDFDDVDDR